MTRLLIAAAFLATALLTASLLLSDSAAPRADYTTFVEIQRDTGNRAEGIALVKQASEQHAAKQYAEAVASYDRAAAKLPQIADWLAVFAASSASYLGDTAEVARRLNAVDAPLARFAWRSRVRAFAESGAKTRALTLARAEIASTSAATQAAAWWLIFDLDADPSVTDRLAAGRAFIANGETGSGIRELEKAVTAGVLSLRERGQIRYELGRAYFATGKYKDAIRNLDRVPRDHARAADARLLMARAQYRDGREADGRATFRKVASEFPKSGAATRALFFLADLAHDDAELDNAAAYFKRAAAAPVKTNESALAMMRLGSIAFTRGKFDEAERIFQQYRKENPNGAYLDQATYWAARSAASRGNNALANELFTSLRNKTAVSYYGMLAREEAGAAALVAGAPAGPLTDSTTALSVQKNLDRWQLLRDIGWNDAAAVELNRVKQHFAGNTAALYQLAESLNSLGAPHLGIALGRELLSSNSQWNMRLFKIMYPLPYMDVIMREARAYRLDPYFVAALIRQESRFNARARSGAGAIGLMQVMPATGRQLQKSVGVGPVTAETLTDPVTNIKLGTRFLADVMNTYDGHDELALIAYNAGPSRASRWRNFPEFDLDKLFVERIPFDETRDYVKVVKLNAAIYRALYPAPLTGI